MIQTLSTSRSCHTDPKRFLQINFDLRMSATSSLFLLSYRYHIFSQSPGSILFYWNNKNCTVFWSSVPFTWECSIINRLLCLLGFVISIVITRCPDSFTTFFFYNSFLEFRVFVCLFWVSFFSKNPVFPQHLQEAFLFTSLHYDYLGTVKLRTLTV